MKQSSRWMILATALLLPACGDSAGGDREDDLFETDPGAAAPDVTPATTPPAVPTTPPLETFDTTSRVDVGAVPPDSPATAP